jgi:uncharacterized protein YfaS (alpha-2-macroglobulin family)
MDTTPTISLRLTENPDIPLPKTEVIPRVPAEKLTETETEELLRQLPPPTESPEPPGFRFPERAVPPPPTGGFTEVVFEDFDAAGPERPQIEIGQLGDTEPLEILRFGPEGEVQIAPSLGITFSQPMVPVGMATDAVVTDPPVELSPLPPGCWRWLDTRTLQFEPEHRFPMATVYTVRVPAGTASQWGGRLESELTWTFSTPAPLISETSSTNRTMPTRPVIAVRFNQRVAPVTALSFASASIGETPLRIIPADEADLSTDEPARQLMKNAQPGYAVAFRIVTADGRPIPAGSKVDLVFAKGIPSLEGPRASDKVQKRPFKVCQSFRALGARASHDFNPFGSISIKLNNTPDGKAFTPSQIKVEPNLERLSVRVSYESIEFSGVLQPRTTYHVTVSADLKDEFGQTLGRESVFQAKTGDGGPFFELTDQLAFHPVNHPFVTLKSLGHKRFRITIRAVEPEDWPAYAKAKFERSYREKSLPEFPGKIVFSGEVAVEKQPRESDQTRIDLAPYVAASHLHFIVSVESLLPRQKHDFLNERYVSNWISYNELGLEAVADHQRMDVRVMTRDGFEPVTGVSLTLLPQNIAATTDAAGCATFSVPPDPKQFFFCLVASHDGKNNLLIPGELEFDEHTGKRLNSWFQSVPTIRNAAFAFTDRGLYRPGEQVRFTGWLRSIELSPFGDIRLPDDRERKLRFDVSDAGPTRIVRGFCEVDENGGFDAIFTLPKACTSGRATIRCCLSGEKEGEIFDLLTFKIAEFRRPEFETRLLPADSGPYSVGDAISFTAEAAYYAGGSLPDTAIQWNVEATRSEYIPPNRNDFNFGEWRPWWLRWFHRFDKWAFDGSRTRTTSQGTTNIHGRHGVTLETGTTLTHGAIRLTVEATVQDVNRQAMSGKGSFLVHPAAYYVGIRSTAQFFGSGNPLFIETIVTDPDGNAVAGRPVTIRLARIEETFEDGETVKNFLNLFEKPLVSAEEPVMVTLRPPTGGRYRVTAIVTDTHGRASASETRVWVAGETTTDAEDGEYIQRNVELIPDRAEYAPGETAEILVRSPFQTSEGILAITRNGIVRTERFSMAETSHVLKIPIEENWTPNVHLEVSVVGPVPETVRRRFPDKTVPSTASAHDSLELKIPPTRRALSVAVIPAVSALEPGGETVITIAVKNADGQPVAEAVVAVIVADEAILNLADYRIGNPIDTFYPSRDSDVDISHNRIDFNEMLAFGELERQGPQELSRRGGSFHFGSAIVAAAAGVANETDHNLPFRTDFNPLAYFSPSVKTDAEGHATVTVKLPDNLTRYRVTAVAVSGAAHFGVGESLITARLPLMLRPSPPRFLNHGDRCELPLVLQNLTDAELAVSVATRAANAGLPDGAGRRVAVPANDRVEVRFDVTTERPGTARFDFIAAAPETRPDATTVAFPVYTPTVAESFAVYGVVDDGATGHAVRRPDDAIEGFGSLEVSTAATQMQSLTDAVLYLKRYPFDCTEQIASRILGAVTVRNFLETFNIPDIPSHEELTREIRRDLSTLAQYQQSDGGFGFWNRDSRPFPFLAAYVGLVLTVAAEQGISAPDSLRKQVLGYLNEIRRFIPKDYSEESRRVIAAFALAVRARNGDCDRTEIRYLVSKSQGALPIEALGWLLRAVGADPELASERTLLLRRLTNQVTETAGKAHFVAQYVDRTDVMLATDRRADGIILDALIVADPNHDLIPKLARGLLDARRRGRWHTTQENGFALTALENYFRTYESETPDFIARWWLGEQFAGEHAFAGRTTVTAKSDIPLAALTDETVPMTLQKEGSGRLYYRIGLTYAPEVPDSRPFSAGFEVERFYEGVENPDDVTHDPDGAWRIRAGALVRVKVSMTTRTPRNHVALVDPLPAGLEALNPELVGTQSLPSNNDDEQRNGWWWRRWYSHHNLRDDRAEAFAEWLWAGSYTFTYYARATTPGEFIVPPAKAEEMYHPETFGRTGVGKVTVWIQEDFRATHAAPHAGKLREPKDGRRSTDMGIRP